MACPIQPRRPAPDVARCLGANRTDDRLQRLTRRDQPPREDETPGRPNSRVPPSALPTSLRHGSPPLPQHGRQDVSSGVPRIERIEARQLMIDTGEALRRRSVAGHAIEHDINEQREALPVASQGKLLDDLRRRANLCPRLPRNGCDRPPEADRSVVPDRTTDRGRCNSSPLRRRAVRQGQSLVASSDGANRGEPHSMLGHRRRLTYRRPSPLRCRAPSWK